MPFVFRCSAVVSVLFGIWAASADAGEQSPIAIGSRLELFVDRLLIESLQGVELKLHEPIKAPRAKSPLPVQHMMTVLRDGKKFRAYYRGSDPSYRGEPHTGHPGETVHYAESDDGREWTFPQLGLHEVGGTRANNVILAAAPPFATNFMPFLDARPAVDPAERYKALAGYPGPGDKRGLDEPGRGLFAFVSGDGIHWTKKAEAIRYRPEWRHAFDSPNVSFWSPAEQCYVCYFRTWTEPDRLRSISRATSPDFVSWSDPVEMKPNLPGEHLYTNMTSPYFRAPHFYIALPTRFVPGRGNAPQYDQKDVNATDVLLMTMRAGSTHYDRTFKEAFIRPGLDPAQWINRANYVAENILPTGPNELSIYHRSGDRYVLRTDGFISAHAGYEPGELVTKPITFAGDELHVNLATSAAGSLRVEVQDLAGEPIAGLALENCVPLYGDGIDLVVRWHADKLPPSLAGEPVRLRFVLQECDLYSFQFR
ncbi:MAG: hypothetical protein JNL96_15535 [Planctomycetaceae bacterium]|nr:hypothetical protein [Planctomycetaceae bacterium]